MKLRLAIFFLLLFVFGLIGCITCGVNRSKAMKTDIDFNTLHSSDFSDGMYVRGTVYELLDEYAYETTDSRVSSRYYVMPLAGTFGDEYPQYITLAIGNSDVQKQADVLMQQTWDYYDYDKEPAVWNEFEIVGKVETLDSDLLDYLYDWFMYGDAGATRAEYSKYICPYEISFVSPDGLRMGAITSGVMAGVGVIGLAVFIIIYIRARNNCY